MVSYERDGVSRAQIQCICIRGIDIVVIFVCVVIVFYFKLVFGATHLPKAEN